MRRAGRSRFPREFGAPLRRPLFSRANRTWRQEGAGTSLGTPGKGRSPGRCKKTGGKGPFFCSRERKEGARNTPGQSAVTRSRTEVAAATTQSTNHYTITARHRALRRHGALIFVLGVKRIRAVLHRLWRMQGFLFFTSSCPPTSFPSLPLSLSLF